MKDLLINQALMIMIVKQINKSLEADQPRSIKHHILPACLLA
jgi:hypothetical protein